MSRIDAARRPHAPSLPAAPPPAAPAASRRAAAPSPPDARLDRAFLANLRAQAAASGATRGVTRRVSATSAPAATATKAAAAAAAPRAKLDALRDAYSGPYRVGGEAVAARPMFRMNGGINEESARARAAELTGICRRAGLRDEASALARLGRATPEQLVRVTQSLIDDGRLPAPPPASTETRIRRMQWEWGIGLDCAGYTARAAIAVHGDHGRALLGDMTDRFAAMARGELPFVRVGVADIRAGDVIHLRPPGPGEVGHNVIVHDHRVVGDTERRVASAPSATAGEFFASPGPFHALDVDSSWGAGDGQDYGGFRRDTWYYDASSGRWAYFERDTREMRTSTRGPCDEPYGGAYRPRGVR